jgi:hypothetical protein
VTGTQRIFDGESATGWLESVQIYLQEDSEERLVFQLGQIEYNQPIDPGTFTLKLPENVM